MLKILFLTHRYLGITLGILMVLWCLSGFIMMYKPYPELSREESLALLNTLDLQDCCDPVSAQGLEETRYQGFQVQMLDSLPVLQLTGEDGRLVTLDLHHQRLFYSVQEKFAQQIAGNFAEQRQFPDARLMGEIYNDQWTVYGAYNPHRPLYHLAADDDQGTQWYMSSRTGEVIQLTTREQRIWGYLGAVIHWLYPTMLREKVLLWSQTVIWLTIASIFLTCTGLYFGLRQYKTRNSGRKSPYWGLSRWHHYAGLSFGVLTFSWVLSGLFSMQPWGLMEGEGAAPEEAQLRGSNMAWAAVSEAVSRLPALDLPADTVRVEGQLLQGQLALYAVNRNGAKQRYSTDNFNSAALEAHTLQALAAQLSPGGPPISAELITGEDAYYFNHHEQVQLPAFRVIANDSKQTRYYLDPVSGEVLDKIDTKDRWYRWLHYGLHRGDFTLFLRSRPVWDILMWTLLLGVTVVCITGMLMGFRRISRSV